MKAGLSSQPFSQKNRRGEVNPFSFIRLDFWEAILRFAKNNQWLGITILGVTTILLEMGEHLQLLPNPNLFFYGEVTLVTILLIFAGLAKTSPASKTGNGNETRAHSERGEALLSRQLLEEKIQAVQKEIARDLHDTLGQNISYLRMRLEYLAETAHSPKINLKAEISSMAEVAEESYDLVRGMLAALQAKASNGLFPLLSGHARQVAERSSIQIDINEKGSPRLLSVNHLLQIFFIFREAIYNIEKHAYASRASVNIEWSEAGLLLSISDNGCGFDPANLEKSNHYGLRFMRERAERLNGIFFIHSYLGAGTTVAVRLQSA